MKRLVEALEIQTASSTSSSPDWIHVAGTNGKGSTCAFQASICGTSGLRTGLYTSPHLVSFRERIQINGIPIPEADAFEGLVRIRKLSEHWETPPTFFEILTALALDYFQRERVDVAILETGLGGRLDATNVVLPTVSVITPIGLDHRQVLGNTLAEIAREKAGIIKPNVPVVSAPQDPEVRAVLELEASKQGCHIDWVQAPWEASPLGLSGSFQKWNAALAVQALKAANLHVPMETVSKGLSSVSWPGRFQRINETLILDGAHNPSAARALAETWKTEFPHQKASLIFGAMADKDVRGVLCELLPIASEVRFVEVQNPRAISASNLTSLAQSIAPWLPIQPARDLGHSLVETSAKVKLVCGSLYLVGEVLALLQGTELERSCQ